MAVKHSQETRKPPGRKVGVIVASTDKAGTQGTPEAPLVIYWAVDRYRKDYGDVLRQEKEAENARLPKYAASLFDSCFKNWG